MAVPLYDDPDFFREYSNLPRSREGLAAAPEWPALRAMLPPMDGATVLDLGCGFGAFARWAVGEGARHVVAIDISERMLAEARSRTQDQPIAYRHGDIARLDLPGPSFDLVYSSLAFHYIDDLASLFASIGKLIAPGGSLVFSVEHPIFTAPSHPAWQDIPGVGRVWPLNNYLAEGKRITNWLAPGVVKYHHTTATYVNLLLHNGFALTSIEDWAPSLADIARHPEWADEVHRPPFLLVGARRNGSSS